MKKLSLLDSIDVSSPCSQEWDSMQGTDEIRFCDHCAKHVHNLSVLTDKDVRKLILRSQGNICARYMRAPDGRIQTLKYRLHQITRQAGIAAGVLGTSLTVSTLAYSQNTEPAAPQQENLPAAELTINENTTPSSSVSGVITDQNGAVITFANVSIFSEATSFYQSVPTNAEGVYEFKNLPEGKYKLKVDASGFEGKELSEIFVSAGSPGKQDVQLSVFKFEEKVEVGSSGAGQSVTLNGMVSCTYTESNATKNKLIIAVQNEDVDEVKNLIGQGKRVNAKNSADDGNFALHYAVENGNIDIVQLLLNAGAKISVKNYNKRTPLMMLDYDASADLVNTLLRFGAAVNATDKDKNTALILAAGNASEEVVRVLILNGADVNAKNKMGRTALMLAAEQGNLENVKALLEGGADANAPDRKGQTAWAMASGQDIKQLLTTFGAVAETQ